jgi:hypothetical protein
MAPTSLSHDLMTSLSLGVSVVICNVCEPREAGTSLSLLETKAHPSVLSQQAVLGDSKEVELRPDVCELLRKVMVSEEVGLEPGVTDVSSFVHEEVTPP